MKRLLNAFIYTSILALCSLLIVTFMWDKPLMLTAVVISLSALMMLVHKDIEDLYLYIIIGSMGAAAEIIAIVSGAWEYAFPNLVGIPYWLPFLWGIAGLFIKRIVIEIHEYIKSVRK